jgi:cellulose synthase/poly-beta-1,6-N-acetylglucosamine synthase-like glycosyltransferase
MSGLEWWFWGLVLAGLYPYLIYPLLVAVLGRLVNRRVAAADGHLPRVTVLTAAFNEAKHIEATVRNKLAQDYPAHLLDVVVVSDESVDGTDAIVERIAAETGRVRLLRQVPRQGKTAGLNLAMRAIDADIVVFSDANSLYHRETVRRLVRNFADAEVGYVTGKMVYVNPDGSLVGDGCSAYMRYENALRTAETRIGSIVGADGGVDAVRRGLYEPMRADQLPDFVLPLSVVQRGHRAVFAPDALLTEDALTNQSSEYRMRVRVGLRALWALWDMRGLLNPLRHGLFAWQLWSHKLLRYLSFLPLGAAMLLNWLLLPRGGVYAAAIAGQLAFALLLAFALFGPRRLAGLSLSRYCFYFALLNYASAVALMRFLRGHKQVLWQPRTG